MTTLKKLYSAAKKAGGAAARSARQILPKVLAGREKAVTAFLVPVVAGTILPHLGVHVAASLVEQLILAAVTSFTVHSTTNTSPKEG